MDYNTTSPVTGTESLKDSLCSPARLWAAAGVIALLVGSRLLVAPRYLYYFDSVNFALALERFDPSLHQPQPPGYPLFVLLARAIHLFVLPAQAVFLIAGLFGACLALLLVWLLAREMFTPRAADLAVLAMVLAPTFWLGGVTNQVRVFLATAAAAVALACWRAKATESPSSRLYGASFLLGLLAGLRPGLVVYLGPLLLWAAWRSRRPFRQWVLTGAALAGGVALWLPATMHLTGGPTRYWQLVASYAGDEFRGSSPLFGAQLQAAWRMVKMASVWSGFGALSWLWALPFALPKLRLAWRNESAVFLLVCLLPQLAFLMMVHVGDPDQTLATLPVFALAGGRVLERFAPTRGRFVLAGVAVVLLNALLFIRPPRGLAEASGFSAVRRVDRETQAAFQAIGRLRQAGETMLVANRSFITWRHLYYYFPELPLLVLHGDAGEPPERRKIWLLHKRQSRDVPLQDEALTLKAPLRLIWFLPHDRAARQLPVPAQPFSEAPPLAYTDLAPGGEVRYGALHIVAEGAR